MPKRSRSETPPPAPPTSTSLVPPGSTPERSHSCSPPRSKFKATLDNDAATGNATAPYKDMIFASLLPEVLQPKHECWTCRAKFPSEQILQLHGTERHDPQIASRRARGDMIYVCFLPTCDKIFVTAGRRKQHLIEKHGYPPAFDFHVVDRGLLLGQISMLHDTWSARKENSNLQNRLIRESSSIEYPTANHGSQAGGVPWGDDEGRRRKGGRLGQVKERAARLARVRGGEDGRRTDYDSIEVSTNLFSSDCSVSIENLSSPWDPNASNPKTKYHLRSEVSADKSPTDALTDMPKDLIELDDLSQAMSSLQFLPRSVTQRRSQRKTA